MATYIAKNPKELQTMIEQQVIVKWLLQAGQKVSEALKERVNKKLGKLDRFFSPQTEAHVTMGVQKNRHILEVTIPANGITLRAEVASEDMYSSIDKAADILERQIRKNKTRLEKKLHTDAFKPEFFNPDVTVEEEMDFKVVRTK
jgi:putative sigma-54 modulation protein